MQVLIPAEEFKKKRTKIYAALLAHKELVVEWCGCRISAPVHPIVHVHVEGAEEALEDVGLGANPCLWCGARYGFNREYDGWLRCNNCGGS